VTGVKENEQGIRAIVIANVIHNSTVQFHLWILLAGDGKNGTTVVELLFQYLLEATYLRSE
jgi:hypothetical protein